MRRGLRRALACAIAIAGLASIADASPLPSSASRGGDQPANRVASSFGGPPAEHATTRDASAQARSASAPPAAATRSAAGLSRPNASPRVAVGRSPAPVGGRANRAQGKPSLGRARTGDGGVEERLAMFRATSAENAARLDQFAHDRYGEGGVKALETLRTVGKPFETLVSDPGLVTRVDEFTKFVAAHDLSHAAPWEARNAFAASLGVRTVFRAMALTKGEHEAVLREGIKSPLVLRSERETTYSPPSPSDRARALNGSLAEAVQRRLLGFGGFGDPLMSVAERASVATAAAGIFATKNKEIYLFKLRVPVIDLLVRQRGSAILPSRPVDTQKSLVINSAVGRTIARLPFDSRRAESFVMFRIPASEIVSSHHVLPGHVPTYSIEATTAP